MVFAGIALRQVLIWGAGIVGALFLANKAGEGIKEGAKETTIQASHLILIALIAFLALQLFTRVRRG